MENGRYSPVIGKDGLRGQLVSGPNESTLTPTYMVKLEDGRSVQVPASALVRQADGSYFVPLGMNDLDRGMPPQAEHIPRQEAVRQETARQETALVVPVYQEDLNVEKRLVETGRARITKHVQEHEEVVDEALLREDVQIEHVPINKIWEGAPPPPRYEADKLVIPLLEEVLVVEKRLMLKEELHISRVQKSYRAPQTVVLRSENVTVERVEANSEREAEVPRPV